MPKKVAVIASILKPVDDTRLFEKLGLSISQTNKYQVNIIGFGTKKLDPHPGIRFHTLFSKTRRHPSRLWAPWKFLRMIWKLQPHLLIVSTPELLLPAVIYKILKRRTLWYDLQENYRRNIRHQTVYPTLLKPLLATWVLVMERLAKPFVDHYLLAEQGYLKEMDLPQKKCTILENKFRPLAPAPIKGDPAVTKFIYSGTVAREFGILQAVRLVGDLYRMGHPVQLVVAGHIPQAGLRKELQELQRGDAGAFMQIMAGAQPLSHTLITEQLQQADFGLLAHQPNPSNQNCIPTRIYEFLGLGIPFLLQQHPLWEAVANPYQAALVIDFNACDAGKIWESLHSKAFYTRKPGPEVFWSSEQEKLWSLLDKFD